MARYHVSGDGRPRKCTATSPESCPLAQKDENGKVLNHFDSEAEAGRYGEKIVADGVKSAGSLSKNPLDVMARHAPDDAPDDTAVRTALGALAMRGCKLEKREDGRYEITDVDNDAMIGLMSDRGTFVNGAEVNDDGSVGIGITMNGSIPHWGAEGGHSSWGGGDVSLEAYGDLLLRKNDDGDYELVPDNNEDITSRISFDPRETLENFKYGVNDIDDIDEDDDDGWLDANDEAIRENLSNLSADKCDDFFGAGTSKWIQGSDVAVEAGEFEAGARKRVAEDPNTPVDELEELSMDSDKDVRSAVAGRGDVPASVLSRLSMDSDKDVRYVVAINPSAPASVLAKLSTDSDDYVRMRVAKRRDAPASALAKMSTDSNHTVRSAVAENTNTPASALAKLSTDSSDEVRGGVAWNLSTPASVLSRLSTDSSSYVRCTVAGRQDAPASVLAKLSADPDEDVRGHVAWNSDAPASVLAKLSTDSDELVREYVAGNPSTPPDSLIKLSADSRDVREAVAGNPNTPLNVVAKLAHDEEYAVKSEAWKNLEDRQQKNDR